LRFRASDSSHDLFIPQGLPRCPSASRRPTMIPRALAPANWGLAKARPPGFSAAASTPFPAMKAARPGRRWLWCSYSNCWTGTPACWTKSGPP